MKNKFTTLSLIILISLKSIAQTDSLCLPFQNLDFSFTNTNVLVDYGIKFIPVEKFNGNITDENFVTIKEWRSIYATLQTCLIKDENTFESLENVNTDLNFEDEIIDIPIIAYDYDVLKENSIADNLLYIQNNQLYDVAGRTESPYEKKSVIALAPEDTLHQGMNVQFRINSELFFTNKSESVQNIQIDFDNGNGYQIISWNMTHTVNYTQTGEKELKYKLTFSDGSIEHGHSRFDIVSTSQLKSYPASISDFGSNLTATKDYPSGSGNFGSGRIDISYGHNNGNVLRKPLIVVEGFDTWQISETGDYDYRDFVQDLNGAPFDLNDALESDNLSGFNYDLVFLNFDNGYDYIQRNAYLLERVIQWVNDNKVGDEPNIVMGISMGGLVSRYALADMEKNGVDHETRLFISLDSPHQGANVPLGFQYMAMDLADAKIAGVKLSDEEPDLKLGKEILNTPAAQQMLVVQTSSSRNQVHSDFITEYKNLGYPKQCRCVAISNGSVCGTTQDFNASDELFNLSGNADEYNIKISYGWTALVSGALTYLVGPAGLLVNLISGDYKPYMDFWVKAMPDNTDQKIYKGKIEVEKTTLWLIKTRTTLHETNKNSGVHPAYDNAPGGTTGPSMLGDFDADELPGDADYDEELAFCFVPTYSAFDIPISSTSELQHTFGTDETLLSQTPFDWVLGNTGNNASHLDFFADGDGTFVPDKGNFIWDEVVGNFDRVGCTDVFQDAPLNDIVNTPFFWPWQDSKTYKALNTITSPTDGDFTIKSGKTVSFVAGKEIRLLPGFEVEAGANFSARVDNRDCIWTPVTCSSLKSASIPQSYDYTYYFNTNLKSAKQEELIISDNQDKSSTSINVYPNPVNERLIIEMIGENIDDFTLTLYNIYGSKVSEHRLTNITEIDVNQLNSGLYLYLIGNKNGYIKSGKITKE